NPPLPVATTMFPGFLRFTTTLGLFSVFEPSSAIFLYWARAVPGNRQITRPPRASAVKLLLLRSRCVSELNVILIAAIMLYGARASEKGMLPLAKENAFLGISQRELNIYNTESRERLQPSVCKRHPTLQEF